MKSLRNRCLVGMVGAACLMGCGGSSDQPELGTVTGTVYMDDKPLPNVWVMFSPTTSGRTSMARTDEDGEYELLYLEGTEGANIGTHKVIVMTYHEDEILEMTTPVKEPIPSQYNSKTTLTEEVKAGENVIDLRLQSK